MIGGKILSLLYPYLLIKRLSLSIKIMKKEVDKAIAEAKQIEEEQKVYTITENKATLPPLKTFVLAYIQGIEDPKLVRINNIDYLEWTYPGWGCSVSFGDQWQYLPKRKSNEPENN